LSILASAWARTTTLRARSVNRSNMLVRIGAGPRRGRL